MPGLPASTARGGNAAPAKSRATPGPALRFRIRVTNGDETPVGPGKIALLEAVDTTGSITAAARSLGMSYRRAWLLLDELNRSLERPAVDSTKGGPHGGRSLLTADGRKLIDLYRRIEATASSACHRDIERLLKMLVR